MENIELQLFWLGALPLQIHFVPGNTVHFRASAERGDTEKQVSQPQAERTRVVSSNWAKRQSTFSYNLFVAKPKSNRDSEAEGHAGESIRCVQGYKPEGGHLCRREVGFYKCLVRVDSKPEFIFLCYGVKAYKRKPSSFRNAFASARSRTHRSFVSLGSLRTQDS